MKKPARRDLYCVRCAVYWSVRPWLWFWYQCPACGLRLVERPKPARGAELRPGVEGEWSDPDEQKRSLNGLPRRRREGKKAIDGDPVADPRE